MSALAVHALLPAALAALAVPVVILYFLRLKRPRLEVPSLALWRVVQQDRRVNAPFQRFRRHLPLLLQLLLLALLVAAAMQPYLRDGPPVQGRVPVLIDCGASLGARTAPGGPTRLELIQRQLHARIAHLASGEQLCLIAFADQARQLTGFTDDRRELAAAVDALTVEHVGAVLAPALALAQGLWRAGGFDHAELVSDGDLPEQVDVDLAFRLEYAPLEAPVPNAGITALDASRRADGRWDIFCAVEAADEVPAGLRLRLSADGVPITERALPLTAGGSERLVATIDGSAPAIVRADLSAVGFDALADDDHATLVLPALRPLRAWVDPNAVAWRRAVAPLPGVRLDPPIAEGAAAAPAPPAPPSEGYDLAITTTSDAPTARLRLDDGVVPPALAALVTTASGTSAVVDWRRSEPLLAHVDLHDLVIATRVAYAAGADEAAVEEAGWRVLVHGDQGPLLVTREQGEHTACALLFPSAQSTLPYRIALPVLAANLVAIARSATGQAEAHALPTGVLPAVRADPGTAVVLSGPGQERQRVTADSDGFAAGLRLTAPGLYQLHLGATTTPVGCGLLAAGVTHLTRAANLGFRDHASTVVPASAHAERPLWPLLAAAALLVCLFEWWYAHRRPWSTA